jgi:predicted anti-sigma-YlaC factor YlaD
MRCDEIQERLVEILYGESAGSSDHAEIQEHLRTCPACRRELSGLEQTRGFLQLWKDESPPQSPAALLRKAFNPPAPRWRYLRYAAIAAMALICLLSLANTQVTWNREGFSFSTRLWGNRATDRDYYTKSEVRDLLDRALEDSEYRVSETNYVMIQKMLDMLEQDRWMDLRLTRGAAVRNPNKN